MRLLAFGPMCPRMEHGAPTSSPEPSGSVSGGTPGGPAPTGSGQPAWASQTTYHSGSGKTGWEAPHPAEAGTQVTCPESSLADQDTGVGRKQGVRGPHTAQMTVREGRASWMSPSAPRPVGVDVGGALPGGVTAPNFQLGSQRARLCGWAPLADSRLAPAQGC